MLAPIEWLSLGWKLAIPVLIGIALFEIANRFRKTNAPFVNGARVRGATPDVLHDLQLATSGISNVVPTTETPDSITLKWSYIPTWAFLVGFVAFPVGLIALLARTSVNATVIIVQESENTSVLRMAGTFHPKTVKGINSVIDFRSQVAPPGAPTPFSPAR